jgi:hypothetical protein
MPLATPFGDRWTCHRDQGSGAVCRSACCGIHDVLCGLVRARLLIPYSELNARLQAGEDSGASSRIDILAICTKDRPKLLRRAVETYGASSKEHHADTQFLVYDDTLDRDVERQSRRHLREVAAVLGLRAGYANVDEKRRFAERVASLSGVPVERVVCALLGDPLLPSGPGGNRSCMLLDSVGHLVLTADDDTIGRTAMPPDASHVMRFRSVHDPTRTRWNRGAHRVRRKW